MEASKLSINPDHIRFQKMTRGKRADLRRQNIIALISSKPYGKAITLDEFAAVCATSQASAHAMLQTMVKRGVVSKEKISGRKIIYSVNGEPKIVKPKQEVIQPVQRSLPTLTDMAQKFAWEQNSDSLRDFVKWVDGKELDLRRLADR